MMPILLRCPNGHQWELPAGAPPAAGPETALCPVCGALEQTRAFAPPSADLPPGGPARPHLPGYEVLEEVGRGGMGVVYKARQLATRQIVALKVIRKERLANPDAVRRFLRESQAAARLSHPNIVAVHEADQVGDTPFLTMEFVEGVTLQRLVEQHGPLPPALACDFIRQAALGLQHAHEQGLVHRDIKPGNVMLAVPGGAADRLPPMGTLAKILDMGVARLYATGDHDESLTTLTQDGAVLGTPDYVAPEQLEDAHAADIRADLYSLGCTFFYLLTGQVPFPGGTLIQKLDRQRWEAPPWADEVRPEVPAAVGAVVRKLMAKSPADRYPTPADLAAALEQLGRAGHVAPAPPAARREETRRFDGHSDEVWAVAFLPDGRTALSGGKDRALVLWDVEAGRELRRFGEQPQEVRGVAVSPDGRLALSASGVTIRIWDVAKGQEVGRYAGHTNTVRGVAFSPDGKRALSAGDGRALVLWDVAGRREVRRFVGHKGEVLCAAFSPDGKLGLSGGRDQTLRLWDLATGKEVPRFPKQKGMVLGVAFSPDGRRVLAGSFDTTLRLWDPARGRELRRLQGHKQMVTAVAFTRDGQRALSASHDQTVRLWHLESGREVCVFAGHTAAVTCLAVSPDGRFVLSGAADRTLRLWQLPD